MDILYILKVLWKKKLWLIVIPMLSAIAAYFFSLSLDEQYKSNSRIATGYTTSEAIQVTDERANPREVDMNFSNMLTTMNSGICNNLVSYRLVLHDLDSPSIAFRKFENDPDEPLSKENLEIARQTFHDKLKRLEPLNVDDPHADILLRTLDAYGYGYPYIKDKLLTYRVPDTDYIHVEFVSENPKLSAYAVNAFCEEFLRYFREIKTEGSTISVSFFEQLVEQKKKVLDEKSEMLKTFKATNNFVNLSDEGNSRVSQIAELEQQQDAIQSNIYGLNLQIDRYNRELEDIERGGGSDKANARVVQLRERIARLNEQYLNSGSTSRVLADSLNMLRDQLRRELAAVSMGPDAYKEMTAPEIRSKLNDLKIERAKEESRLVAVQSRLNSIRGSISGYASKEAVVAGLQADVDVASKEYLEAVNKYNEARNKLKASTSTIRTLYKATPAAKPMDDNQLLIVIAAGFTTFCFTIFVIVLMEFLDTTLKHPNKFKRALGLPLAEILIRVDTQAINFNTLFDYKTNDVELETFKEYVRKLRYQIETTNSKILLFTSCKRGEGKTFVIFTLAYVLSLVNKKVLIIDTNFKNNTLTRWLGAKKPNVKLLEKKPDQEMKLLTAPVGPTTENHEEEAYELVINTRFRNVFLIGNNGGYDSPDEIISGRNFTRLLEVLAEEYDYIFLEGAALNEYSDSKELIKYADKVIPVFAADTSIGSLDKDSISFLKTLGKKLSGAILNKVELSNLKLM